MNISVFYGSSLSRNKEIVKIPSNHHSPQPQRTRAVNTWSTESGTTTIDLSAVPQGAYFVKVVSRGSVSVRKLIVK